jgi:hypothetical protein
LLFIRFSPLGQTGVRSGTIRRSRFSPEERHCAPSKHLLLRCPRVAPGLVRAVRPAEDRVQLLL